LAVATDENTSAEVAAAIQAHEASMATSGTSAVHAGHYEMPFNVVKDDIEQNLNTLWEQLKRGLTALQTSTSTGAGGADVEPSAEPETIGAGTDAELVAAQEQLQVARAQFEAERLKFEADRASFMQLMALQKSKMQSPARQPLSPHGQTRVTQMTEKATRKNDENAVASSPVVAAKVAAGRGLGAFSPLGRQAIGRVATATITQTASPLRFPGNVMRMKMDDAESRVIDVGNELDSYLAGCTEAM
jgi:hypothetical protein